MFSIIFTEVKYSMTTFLSLHREPLVDNEIMWNDFFSIKTLECENSIRGL